MSGASLGDESDGPVVARVDDRVRVDTEEMVERAAEALDLAKRVGHLLAAAVGGADHGAAPEAAAGRQHELCVIPMIAAGVGIAAADAQEIAPIDGTERVATRFHEPPMPQRCHDIAILADHDGHKGKETSGGRSGHLAIQGESHAMALGV